MNVTAGTKIVSVTAAQAGASAAKFGLALTGALNVITNQAIAYIDSTATVTANDQGNVNLTANSDLTSVDLGFALSSSLGSTPMGAGGLETAAQAGVGLTAGANVFLNTTKAFIGDVAHSTKFTTPGVVHANGTVNINAANQEVLVGLSTG